MAPKKDTKRKSTSDKESEKDTKKEETPKKTRQTTKDKSKDSKPKDASKETKKEKPEKKEPEPITVGRGEIDKVLDHLTGALLKELLEGNHIKKGKTTQKKACIKEILELAGKKGQNILFQSLEKEDLKSALETLSKEPLDHDNKSKMLAEVKAKFTSLGHKEFFKALNKDTLVKFAAALEFMEEDATKEELESALEEEILIAGLKEVFGNMAKDFVVDVAKTLNIPHTGTKKALEDRILAIAYPHLKEEEEEAGAGEKKKKAEKKGESEKVVTDISKINKDSTFEDLYQYYTKDLHDFAEKNGLKKTGTKKQLVQRILAWYKDPEAKGVKPQKPGEGKKKRKKSEAQKKKEAKEKREAKKKTEGEAGGEAKTKKEEKKDDKKTTTKGKAK